MVTAVDNTGTAVKSRVKIIIEYLIGSGPIRQVNSMPVVYYVINDPGLIKIKPIAGRFPGKTKPTSRFP
jgi:hypothetical protein